MEKLTSFNQKVIDWLNLPVKDRNLEVGATLMLQSNKNRILHQNVIRRSNFDKIEYELQKYITLNKISEASGTLSEIAKITILETEAFKISKQIETNLRGKRSDHDSLPDDIKNLFEINLVIYHEMRSIHEKLKLLSAENYDAAIREPFLIDLISKRDRIANNWIVYDRFDFSKKIPVKEIKPIDFQRLNSNRVYIGRAIKEVPEKIKSGKSNAASAQITEAQKRYNELMSSGQEVKPETIEGLKAIGVIVEASE